MDYEIKYDKGCLQLILVAIVLFVIFYGLPAMECNAKTANIGFPSRYGIMAGCQIEVEQGKWIPLEAYYFKQE